MAGGARGWVAGQHGHPTFICDAGVKASVSEDSTHVKRAEQLLFPHSSFILYSRLADRQFSKPKCAWRHYNRENKLIVILLLILCFIFLASNSLTSFRYSNLHLFVPIRRGTNNTETAGSPSLPRESSRLKGKQGLTEVCFVTSGKLV